MSMLHVYIICSSSCSVLNCMFSMLHWALYYMGSTKWSGPTPLSICRNWWTLLQKVYEKYKLELVLLVYLHFLMYDANGVTGNSFENVLGIMALPFKDPVVKTLRRRLLSPHVPGELIQSNSRPVANLTIFGPDWMLKEKHGANNILMSYGIDA